MAYRRNIPRALKRIRRRIGLGDVTTTITTAANVVADPYFNETVCRVNQLRALENGKPAENCAVTPAGITGGVGLRKAMPALRLYVQAERYSPWSYVAGAAVVLGLPIMIGYAIAKGGA